MVGQYLALDVLGHGAGEHDFLQVAAFEHQAFGGVLVGDAHHVLLDDGAGVELARHVVACRTDDFHTALPGLMVGLGAYEGGEEGVVDVDDVVGIGGYHVVCHNLHVTGKHDEGNTLFLQQRHLGGLHLRLVGVVLGDGPHIEGYVELLGDVAQVLVVAHDAGDVHLPLACLVTGKEVVEAVAHLAHEDGHTGTDVVEIEVESHVVALGVECRDVFLYLFTRDEKVIKLPLDAHEEHTILAVHVLVQINDVALVVGDELGHFGYDALLVGAVEQQYGGRSLHFSFSKLK